MIITLEMKLQFLGKSLSFQEIVFSSEVDSTFLCETASVKPLKIGLKDL